MAIERLIKEMREKAIKQVETKEKEKRKKMTQVEVTSSIDTKSMIRGRKDLAVKRKQVIGDGDGFVRTAPESESAVENQLLSFN